MSLNSSSVMIETPAFFNSSFSTQTPIYLSSETIFQPHRQPPCQPQPTSTSTSTFTHSSSIATYFASIKKQIQNKEFNNQEQTLKQVTTIFVNQTEKDQNCIIKVILACINIVCLILHSQKSLKRELVKCVVNLRFVGSLLRFGVQRIIRENPGIESSLCYLLQLCQDQRFFDCGKTKGLIAPYKQAAFGLLRNISGSPKVVFNTLRIIENLQKSDLLESQDYIRYDIIRTIRDTTTTCREDNYPVYELAYRILFASNYHEDAVKLFKDLSFNCRSINSSKAFFKASCQSSKPLSSSSFSSSLLHHISSQSSQPSQRSQQRSQQPFYRWIIRQVQVIQPLSLLNLLQSQIVEALMMKYNEVMSRRDLMEMKDFVRALITIKSKAKNLMLDQAVQDKITMMPEKLEPREGLPSFDIQF